MKWHKKHPKPAPEPLVWYHRDYLINLPEQPKSVIRQEFKKLGIGGHILNVGVVRSPEQLKNLYEQIALVNNYRARAVKGKYPLQWSKVKVVVWRGCWAIKQQVVPGRWW